MKNLRTAALGLVLLLGAGTCGVVGAECDRISVTGRAKIERTPDVCYVTLYARGDGILMTDAAKSLQDGVEAVTQAVRETKADVRNIDVRILQAGEKQSRVWSSDAKDSPPRPELIARLVFTVPAVESVAYEITDAAMRAGAVLEIPSMTHYSGELKTALAYGISDEAGLEAELQTKAMDDARAGAEKNAALMGRKLGKVVSIGCQSAGGSTPSFSDGRRVTYPTKFVGSDPGRVEATYSMSVSFEYTD